MATTGGEEDGDYRRRVCWGLEEERKMETRREGEVGGNYRKGGRWRLEKRRKMAAISGGKEDGD